MGKEQGECVLHAIIESRETQFFSGRLSLACLSACFFPFSKPILIGLLDNQAALAD
jgi:hypothetical protein